MSYTELKKLYYSDNETYAQEYLNRFNSEQAIKINLFIGDHQAFFMENAEVLKLAFNISKLDKEISELCAKLPGIAIEHYSKKCLIDEIVITNRIEGVHSSRKEIGEALDILETQLEAKGKQPRFLGLVNKYLKLIKSEKISLDNCKDIRDIYDEIFLEEILHEDSTNKPDGVLFRKGSVTIYSQTDKAIHKGLTPENRIIEALEQALSFLKDEAIERLFRICIFHYLIEYIHPFYDGNGRLGRFILSYGISNTLTPLISFRISEIIKANSTAYYKAFEICNDSRNLGDTTPFLIMLLEMIFMAMKDLKQSLHERLTTWIKYEHAIVAHCDNLKLRSLYSLLIQAALFSEKGISMTELQHNMKSSSYIIKSLLAMLPQELLVVKIKKKFKYYSIDPVRLNALILKESIESITAE